MDGISWPDGVEAAAQARPQPAGKPQPITWPAGVVAAVTPETLDLVYLAELDPVEQVSATDATFWCDNLTGCNEGVALKRVTAEQIGNWTLEQLTGIAPIVTLQNTVSLAIDNTLSVVDGRLHVAAVGGVPEAPAGALVYGRGNATWTPVLPLTGGTVSGEVLSTVTPSSNNALATNQQLYDVAAAAAATYLPYSGGVVTGQIISSLNPTNADALTTNRILNDGLGNISAALGNYLPLGGGTLTGQLILSRDPIPGDPPTMAATKNYVDEMGSGPPGGFLPISGGTMTGSIGFSTINIGLLFPAGSGIYEDAVGGSALRLKTANFPATIETVVNPAGTRTPIITQTSGDARYLQLTGGTVSGELVLTAAITNPLQAATKMYVDAGGGGGGGPFLPLSGGVMAGPITMTALASGAGTFMTQSGGGLYGRAIAFGEAGCGFERPGPIGSATSDLHLVFGGIPVMTWNATTQVSALNLSMNNRSITGLAGPPVNDTDAANKAYVDSMAGSGFTPPLATNLGGTGNVGPYLMNGLIGGVIIGGAAGTSLTTSQYMVQGSNNRSLQFYQALSIANQGAELNYVTTRGAFPPNAPGLQPTQSGDALGTISFDGFDNNIFQPVYSTSIRAFADENWTPTAHGSHIEIAVTPAGGTGAVTQVNIGATGVILANPLAIASGGTGAITAPAARTNLGLSVLATQPSPLGSLYGGTQIPPANISTAPGFNNLIATPNALGTAYQIINSGPASTVPVAAGSVLQANPTGPPSFVLPVAVTSGGTGTVGPFASSFGDPGLVYANGASPLASSAFWSINATTGNGEVLQETVASPDMVPTIALYRARGTPSSPSAVLAGDRLGSLFFEGYGETQWGTSYAAAISAAATETWTNTANGTLLAFGTTSNGNNQLAVSFRAQRGVWVGDPSGGDLGGGTLNAMALYVNGGPVGGGFAASWVAGTNPNNAVLVVAPRQMTIVAITGVVRVQNGGTATINVTNSSGIPVNAVIFDANALPGVQHLNVSVPTLASGDYLVLSVVSGVFTQSVGNITVFLA